MRRGMHRNARKQNVASLFPDITMHDSLFASSLSCFLVNGKKKGEQQKGITWGINRNTDKSLKADVTVKKKKKKTPVAVKGRLVKSLAFQMPHSHTRY